MDLAPSSSTRTGHPSPRGQRGQRAGHAWALAAALLLGLSLAHAQAPALRTEVVARGLENPWAVAFLEGGRFLVTERPGRLRMVQANGDLGPPIEGLPAVDAAGQGGLLDLVLDSQFAQNRRLYFCYAEPGPGGNSTALAAARLSTDGRRLEQLQVLFSQKPKVTSRLHFGCRIAEAPDGRLFLALGERYSRMADAQRLDNHHGKLVRIAKDGSVPPDNPHVGRAGVLPEIWSHGHRNPQGATLGPDGRLWMHEHGPQGGDEINRPLPGRNYGWPVITHGENYGGGVIGEGQSARAGMEPPLHHWTPSIAPSGMAFLKSERYGPAWRGQLFVGSLKFGYLARLELDGTRVLGEHKLLTDLGQRVRDVREGPDGLLYLLTDERQGQLLRVLPR